MKNHHILIKLLITATCFLFTTNINLKAQTINDAFASIADTIGQSNYFTVALSDSTGISQIEVRLGTALSDSSIVFRVFDFDSQNTVPPTCTYERTGLILKLGVGSVSQNAMYYGECRLKDTNGTWSASLQFITN